ncbi:MAG: hypothetical protein NTX87_00010 [Planctomycetota bacterium]|nr:hypothetical protein [Planctomycetota bacterium]
MKPIPAKPAPPLAPCGCRRARAWAGAARLVLVALAALAVTAGPALADRVVTKSGETFTGTLIEDTKEKIVLRTLSGTMTIPRDAVKSVEKAGEEAKPPAPPPQVVVVPVDPAKAPQALQQAKAAIAAGEWIKAAGLLEGLMLLDERTLAADDRLAATGALVTCYLQIKDAAGAAKSLSRRAALAPDANDKRRLVAAADVLRTVGSVEIGGKTLSRLDEVVETAMNWKAQQCLKDAADIAAKAKGIDVPAQLERAATGALKKLSEADVFVPGFSAAHRKEPLAALVNNIIEAAKQAVDYCEKVRPDLTSTAVSSVSSKAAAKAWNDRAIPYFARRQAAEDALRNLPAFTAKLDLADVYKANETVIKDLLVKLDDYQYYPAGTVFPYGGWYGSSYSRTQRIKMQLRRF